MNEIHLATFVSTKSADSFSWVELCAHLLFGQYNYYFCYMLTVLFYLFLAHRPSSISYNFCFCFFWIELFFCSSFLVVQSVVDWWRREGMLAYFLFFFKGLGKSVTLLLGLYWAYLFKFLVAL